ncbi:uncharacterized protein [Triticum aestivum]|uniref:uncharacterized protein n=1 Tax=Triticum aestivum TaxID=4565 RepID=UPI001D020408|nr:uncharacterized protein LOC123114104 [Triticum aestivum]
MGATQRSPDPFCYKSGRVGSAAPPAPPPTTPSPATPASRRREVNSGRLHHHPLAGAHLPLPRYSSSITCSSREEQRICLVASPSAEGVADHGPRVTAPPGRRRPEGQRCSPPELLGRRRWKNRAISVYSQVWLSPWGVLAVLWLDRAALRPRAGATDSQAAGALFDKEHVAVTLGAAVRWKALCLFQKARRIGGSSPPSSPAARRRQKRRSPGDDERSKEDDLQGRSTYATKILLCTSILHTLLSS